MTTDDTGITVPQVSWVVPPDPAAVGPARRRALAEVRSWDVDVPHQVADAIRSVISELVTNAVTHAGKAGPITVDVWLTPRGNLAVVVEDGSPTPPRLRDPYNDGQKGRGLALVAAETVSWGWRRAPGGKAVFATIALPGAKPSSRSSADVLAKHTRDVDPNPLVAPQSVRTPHCALPDPRSPPGYATADGRADLVPAA